MALLGEVCGLCNSRIQKVFIAVHSDRDPLPNKYICYNKLCGRSFVSFFTGLNLEVKDSNLFLSNISAINRFAILPFFGLDSER